MLTISNNIAAPLKEFHVIIALPCLAVGWAKHDMEEELIGKISPPAHLGGTVLEARIREEASHVAFGVSLDMRVTLPGVA